MSRSPYLSNPNILAHPDRIVETVALDLTAQETYLAGSPINAEGKLANDETAIGILLYDVRKRTGGKRGVVVVSGRINQEAAAAWCGITISDAAKSALVNITFSDDGPRMGGGGGGVSSWNDLPDKPFGEEMGLVEILPETSPVYDENEGGFGMTSPLGLVDGETYIVNWNGKEYTSTAVDVSSMSNEPSGSILVMGNLGAMVPDFPKTGEPYVIQDIAANNRSLFLSLDGTTELTLSIAHETTTIKTIDPKFLPESVPSKGVEEVRFVDNLTETSEYSSNYGAFCVHLGMALRQMPLDGNCKIVWDGVTRTHPVVEAEIMGEIYHGFGNLYFFSSFGLDAPNTGEPYAALILPNGYSMVFTMDQSPAEHTVTIMADDAVYQPMDQRYLDIPTLDLVALGMPVLSQSESVTVEGDFANIYETLLKNWIVKVRYQYQAGSVMEYIGAALVNHPVNTEMFTLNVLGMVSWRFDITPTSILGVRR